MPHAIDEQELQEQADDDEIRRLLNPDNTAMPLDIFDDRGLEVGEKAEDAEDYEDIELTDDEGEDVGGGQGLEENARAAQDELTAMDGLADIQFEAGPEQYEDDPDDLDDLFGDEDEQPALPDEPAQSTPAIVQPSPTGGLALPTKGRIALPGSMPSKNILSDADHYGSPASLAHSDEADGRLQSQSDVDMVDDDDEEEDAEVRQQRRLFEQMKAEREERARRGASYEPPQAAETDLETFFNIWPTYDPEERPRFMELFPQRRGVYVGKAPTKAPKAVQPTKLNLELLADQEKSFRLPATALTRDSWLEQQGTILVRDSHNEQDESDDGVEFDELDENEIIGGVSWQDLALVCEDWELHTVSEGDSGVDVSKDWDNDTEGPASKKRKLGHSFDLQEAVAFSHHYPSLEDPERATAKIAKKIQLDMNDPGLLLDENVPTSQPRKLRRLAGDMGREAKSAAARDMTRRYNISNDDAYELLKENHQHKVRSTLGSMAVEHSLPATKLQYPFYRVSLEEKQKRSFHRPTFTTERHERTIVFSRLKKLKRKEQKGKEPTVVFSKAEDLSMADNSSTLLLEYSEEQPVMLSNFGMGNRLINYYRRKDDSDTSRPKEELGETQVLLPQDRSPFANFGQVDPGEMVPTIHNGLYRAPIFKHEGKNTDFLVITNTSSATGRRWFMRNIENIHTVGQLFPSVEVPGEHSRKVTDAAKRRLRSVSYRVHKKYIENRGPPLTNEVVKNHLPGSDIAQNRGKMREFMQYDKNNGLWQLKTGEQIPDAEAMRAWIKPEDICVLDSMQVGVQHLKDLGLRKDEDENDDDAVNEDSNIELLLAPWNTTKNFLNACQGKAMLQLHGEGDPTARGEGFSFIKTSMKGGFRALGESVAERLDAKKLKENGGHSYNVAKQQRAYDESIRRIWKAQHESLSSTIEHSDVEDDVDDEPETNHQRPGETPRSSFGTPSAFGRRDDDSMSQFSKFSANQVNNSIMYIERTVIDKNGQPTKVTDKVTNPRVIAAYKKRKEKERLERMELDAYNIAPSGDRDRDAFALKKVQDEMERLKRNMDRRKARERAKGIPESPSEANSPMPDGTEAGEGATSAPTGKKGRAKKNTEGTARKCANCGQVGHIKTNKKFASTFLCDPCTKSQKEDMTGKGRGSSCRKRKRISAKIEEPTDDNGGVFRPKKRSHHKKKSATATSPLSGPSDWAFSTLPHTY